MSFRKAVVDFGISLASNLVSINALVQAPESSLGGDFPTIGEGRPYDIKVEVRFSCVKGSTKALDIAEAVRAIRDKGQKRCFLRFSFREKFTPTTIYCAVDDNGCETTGYMAMFECHSFGKENGDTLSGFFTIRCDQLARVGRKG